MGVFRIVTDEGTFDVEADSEAAALSAFSQPATPEPLKTDSSARDAFDELNVLEQGAVGLVKPVRQTYLGVKDMVSDLSDEEKNELKVLDTGPHGAAAMAGEVASDIAMMATPLGPAGKIAKYGPKALKALSPFAKDMLKGVGLEGLKAPTDTTSRTDRMAMATAGGMMAKGLGGAMAKLRGIDPSDAAKVIEDMGVESLTHGQRARGGLPRAVENVLGGSPITHQGMREAQDTSLKEFNDIITSKLGKELGVSVPKGREAYAVLEKKHNELYDDLWKDNFKLDVVPIRTAYTRVEKATDSLLDEEAKQVKALLKQFNDELIRNRTGKGVFKGRSIDSAESRLKTATKNAYKEGKPEIGKLLNDLRESLVLGLPKGTQTELARLDSIYSEIIPLRNAAKAGTEGVVTPTGLVKALKDNAGTSKVLSGEARLLKEAEAGVKVFDEISTGTRTPSAESLMNGIASLPAALTRMPVIKEIISGKLPIQQKAAQLAAALEKMGLSNTRLGIAASGTNPDL
tara:strand:+ start:1656 stop:3203 length:1548 start_codon:yes stop_codon:yes gene_type:complete